METDKVPLEKGSPEEILRKLGDNFSLDDGVITALLRLGVESLQEFRFLWASEQAIEPWVAKLGLGDKALLMTARVRRAWAAVGLYYRQVEQDRSKIALSDLDTMLGETELRDTKQQFWRRYKMRFPPEDPPSRHHHLQSRQRDAEAHALRVQHMESENPSIPAHYIAEEAQTQRRTVLGRWRR